MIGFQCSQGLQGFGLSGLGALGNPGVEFGAWAVVLLFLDGKSLGFGRGVVGFFASLAFSGGLFNPGNSFKLPQEPPHPTARTSEPQIPESPENAMGDR